MVEAIIKEIDLRSSELNGEIIQTIYFGGGTPSLLKPENSKKILDQVNSSFDVTSDAEITWEANPEDISVANLNHWKSIGINRLSIGIQSFNDANLIWMNRIHTVEQAQNAITLAQWSGFENINVDLIYGIPGMSFEQWEYNVHQVLESGVKHLSAYHLTIEKKTVLFNHVKRGLQKLAPEHQGVKEVQFLENLLEKNGWERYEISNFCRDKNYAKHNTNYWKGVKYLGFGPSAHSFLGNKRRWNINNNTLYIKGMESDVPNFQIEILSQQDQVNETIMLGLRTQWGLDLKRINTMMDVDFMQYYADEFEIFTRKKWIEIIGNHVVLTHQGQLFADHIASELFFIGVRN